MVKKLLTIGLVGGVAVVSACFGDGPTPTSPSEATILFGATPARSCGEQGTYIGPVAFGSDHVYVSFLPYQRQGGSCNGGGGNGPVMAPQAVFGYALPDGTLEKIGSAGVTNDAHVQLAATDSGVAYAYNETANTSLTFQPGNVTLPAMNGTNIPLGMFAAGHDVYVGTLNSYVTNSGASIAAPNFPNFSATAIMPQSAGEIWHVGSGSAGSWLPSCGALDRCLVGNGSSFVYVGENPGVDASTWALVQVPFGGTTPTKIATSPAGGGLAPLGLDADDHQVAWSTTEQCAQPMGGSFSCFMKSCNVFVYDTTAAMPKPTALLSTQQFACVDAKLANGYVYFAIVEVSSENQQLIGRGVGRVAIADRSVETLDLGITTPTTGPRRVFPIGEHLYLVDPFVLARIPVSALDGKHDFTP